MELPKKIYLKVELTNNYSVRPKFSYRDRYFKFYLVKETKNAKKIIRATKKYLKKLNMYSCNAEIITDNDFFKMNEGEFINEILNQKVKNGEEE